MDEENIKQTITKKDDGMLALAILVVAILAVVIVGFRYFRKNKKASVDPSVFQQKPFEAPPERDAFIKAKAELNPNDPSTPDELKKLLMRRSLQTIPIILSLQNEGTSIERLYEKGMLTDDMHFKVKQLKDFVDEEFNDVKAEADELMEGWGEQIWPQAMQFHQMLQKQNGEKNEEGEGNEDNNDNENETEPGNDQDDGDKKKSESQKRREKEKAKKLAKESSKDDSLSNLSAEDAKRVEAEKMAKKLLEEEEAEKQKQQTSGNKKKGKK